MKKIKTAYPIPVRKILAIATSLAALLLARVFIPPSGGEGELAGKVVHVADGDTLTILTSENKQIRIRLGGVDAPESAQAYGQKSKQALSDLCAGEIATVKIQDKDRYGRTVGTVFCRGENTSALQVKNGWAWVYAPYNKNPELIALENQARAARLGLWRDTRPIPPWDFRKGHNNYSNFHK